MGGLLSAEVALLPSPLPSRAEGCNRRIIGTINFDCPFLGMHPGVVISGIGSIFRSAPETNTTLAPDASEQNLGLKLLPTPSDCTSSSLPGCSSTNISQSQSLNDSLFSENGASLTPVKSVDSGTLSTQQNSLSLASPSSDPCYNPPFPNDIRLPIRTGWENVLHFMNKHSNDLTSAARSLVTSHLEFGGCLADYKGLRSRYTRIRALENVGAQNKARLRFLNYYTASTGRPKKEKAAQGSRPQGQNYHEELLESGKDQGSQQSALSTSKPCSPLQTQLILVEEHRDKGKNLDAPIPEDAFAEDDNRLLSEMDEVDLTALSSDSDIKYTTIGDSLSFSNVNTTSSAHHSFPPLPPPPECPPQFDPAAYTDKDIRNLAQKEYTRQNKTYIRALKDHEKAIQERRKLIEKKEEMERKEMEKSLKQVGKDKKLRDKEGPRPRNPSAARLPSPLNSGESSVLVGSKGDADPVAEKPLRDKKFCMLPPKVNNQADPCWVRVFMKGVDEVGAHCGLFVIGEHYEWLVNDVGKRVQEWVQDSEARR